MRHHDRQQGHHERPGERGIPDSLLVGLLAFLLGLTVLAWLATGLAGLFAHGAWPDGVTFTRTPLALRSLMGAPHDIPAAWPDTSPEQLSGYGLFWGLLIGELMVLLVLTIFVMGILARLRVQRETARAARTAAAEGGTGTAGTPGRRDAYAGAGAGGAGDGDGHGPPGGLPHGSTGVGPGTGTDVGHSNGTSPHPLAGVGSLAGAGFGSGVGAGAGADGSAGHVPGANHGPGGAPHTAAGTATGTATGGPTGTSPTLNGTQGVTAEPEPPRLPGADASPYTAAAPPLPSPLPSPRAPRLLYGTAEARRPTAVQAVLDAEGPALVVTSAPTLWAETKDARAKLGPVLVYDPGHLCDTPARLHWSPTTGCERADIAAARAVALLAPIRPQARLDAAMADTAETLLSSWLHAAAVDGRPFRQVHRWAQGHSAHEAVRILRTHPKASSGAAGLLESALTAYPERREVAQELTVRALAALSSIHIREACTPNRTDSVTLESFAGEGGTLYVVGEAIEDPKSRPGAMPLLTALASSVVEHGRRMAARSSDGRLDPPMTFVLDDVAAVAPLPQVPELLSTGQDRGLPTLVLLRSQEQGRARWPDHTLTAG
ncbi:type IV secretory system conjugative DNA transfer family protein [Streptomyces sp. NPDC002994]|uniref:type IV secretory system conjugative DNA transfer family protein n=1 Tax=Streptomyces sp. NPDC002994 TaxID=3154441 RepID=UPI0033AA0C21